MELIQIIITTLKLFVLLSAIVVLISYFVYKVKDRKRTKPYLQKSFNESPVQSVQIKEENFESKPSRFQVLNAQISPESIVSDDIVIKRQKVKEHFSNNPLKYKKDKVKETFDIYDYYSNSNFEPMHKIKS